MKDWLEHRDGKAFDREEYRKQPAAFKSSFARNVAPYTTMFLNGGFWEEGCPRLLTTEELATLQQQLPPNRLLSVVDVGCDWGVSAAKCASLTSRTNEPMPQGALEFVDKPTIVDDPVIQFDATTRQVSRE